MYTTNYITKTSTKSKVKEALPYVLSLLTFLGGWVSGRRKTSAEAQFKEVEAIEKAVKIWRELALDLRKEVDELKELVSEMRVENIKLKEEIANFKKRI